MEDYLRIFIDSEYPLFLDKYLNTKTLERIKNITQFCGCDYTNLYNPLFFYTRFDHSLVVAHMTWHFTHDKKETLVALFHDAGTPCFAHSIDYVFGDYLKQESSEIKITDLMKKDKELLLYLENDGISLDDFNSFDNYHILENMTPRLCTDRLDGVLHTCYVWLHTHSLEDIKEVYDNIIVLENEDGFKEIGFKDVKICLKFVKMVYIYAKELQSNKDKYVMKFVAEMVKISVNKKLITLDDLYRMKEKDICKIFNDNFNSWCLFNEEKELINTNEKPNNKFYVEVESKKRNTIPLVIYNNKIIRIDKVSMEAKRIYDDYNDFHDTKYCFIERIKELDE